MPGWFSRRLREREVARRISDGSHPPAVDGVFTGGVVGAPSLDRIKASNRGGMIDLIGDVLFKHTASVDYRLFRRVTDVRFRG
jgi:hypothetical protein